MILDAIVANKRRELARRIRAVPEVALRAAAETAAEPRGFAAAVKRLSGENVRVIAEVKKRSPSKGLLVKKFDPVWMARQYAEAGAAAVSVITDRRFFGGCLGYLKRIRPICPVPVLRKDFLIDPYQVYESRVRGADAVLLIVRVLEQVLLTEMVRRTGEMGMTALVEVHDRKDLARAIDAGASVIGINNRDLDSFAVDLGITEELATLIPGGATVVSESGISSRRDIAFLETLGIDAALVGEALVREPSPGEALKLLLGGDADGSRQNLRSEEL